MNWDSLSWIERVVLLALLSDIGIGFTLLWLCFLDILRLELDLRRSKRRAR